MEAKNYPLEAAMKTGGLDVHFAAEVIKRSRTNIYKCYHCRSCAGGCPFHDAMDYGPNGVIRLIQLGLRDEALKSNTIWVCVGCHTCTTQCPMAIDIAAVMDSVAHIALERGVAAAEPGILDLHIEVLKSIERYGRIHEMGIMLRYKFHKRNWFQDLDVGLKMLVKRKIELIPSRIKKIKEIKKLFRSTHV